MAVDSIEFQILSIIRERLSYLKSTRYTLREEFFESPETRFIFNLICNYHSEEKTETLTIRSLRILLNSQVPPTDVNKFRGMIRRIRINLVEDNTVKDKLLRTFCKRQLIKHAVMDAIDKLDSGEESDLERVRQKIDEAISVGNRTATEETYDYFDDPVSRTIHTGEQRIPTGISSEFDSSFEGGLASGEIGIIVAPTGVGKTLLLVNVGYGAILRGKKVVYVTLEISPRKVARRFDVRIAQETYKDIRENPTLVQKKLKVLRARGGGLQIKDYTATQCSVGDLRSYLERLRHSKFNFDLVIVDHADLMYSMKAFKEKRYELSSIVAGLRRLANEFKVPVWTASQATRKAGAAGKTGLWDIAEDIGKANWADLAITISQTEEEKEEGIMWLKVAKNRMGSTNPKIQVFVDYDTMTVKGAKKEISDVRRKLRE